MVSAWERDELNESEVRLTTSIILNLHRVAIPVLHLGWDDLDLKCSSGWLIR